MTYNVEIKIFGEVSDPESIRNLAEAIAEESNFGDPDGLDIARFHETLQDAEAKGSAFLLNKDGYDDVYSGVTEACQQAGLSYVWSIGDRGADSFTNGLAWRPGMLAEIPFIIHDNQPGLSLKVIASAARKGIDEVNALVSTISTATKVGKIEIEPGFMDAYRELVAGCYEDEAAPLQP